MTKVEGAPFILVVEGDDGVLRNEVRSLTEGGFRVIGTSDPWEALQIVASRSLQMMVVDLDLTGPGFGDFYSILQEDPGLAEVSVIFLSKHAASIGTSLVTFPGLNVCLPKPVDPATLVTATGRLLASPFPPDVELPQTPKVMTRFVRRRREPVTV